MTLHAEAIWFRRLTAADFESMERPPGTRYSGGTGASWIDVTGLPELFAFFGRSTAATRTSIAVQARRIGDPSQVAEVRFEPRSSARYRIPDQGRLRPNAQRHPAWDPTIDPAFPMAAGITDRAAAEAALNAVGGLVLYLVRASDGEHYAGYVTGTAAPPGWPPVFAPLFDGTRTLCMTFPSPPPGTTALSPVVLQVLEAWSHKQNVLLYGPPGTGKTHAMSQLRELLSGPAPGTGGPPVVYFDPTNQTNPWVTTTAALPFPAPVSHEWVTFHQSYSYEEFVLGLRPDKTASTLQLRPRLGRLLHLATRVSEPGPIESGVLFIDELNRGNVSRIFGEFITFMDPDYRATDAAGTPNPRVLPVPLSGIDSTAGLTEPLDVPGGGSLQLPDPWHFPHHVYVVASMNSVDRAVAPLDTALGRRFERIEVRADLDLVARVLSVTPAAVLAHLVGRAPADPLPPLTATETAWLLLRRINEHVATSLGVDFELGHSYVLGVQDWPDLARAWDHALWPQLQERYASRPQLLTDFLKIADPNAPAGYLFGTRELLPGMTAVEVPALQVPRVTSGPPTAVTETLVFLAVP